jgi:hypothetical protein
MPQWPLIFQHAAEKKAEETTVSKNETGSSAQYFELDAS